MAAVEVQIPPSNTVVPGSQLLPTAPFPSSGPEPSTSAESVASEWVSSFLQFLNENGGAATNLFVQESSWRDLLCMTWDFRTLQGPEKISSFIKNSSKDSRITNLSLDNSAPHRSPQILALGDLKVIQAFLKVETTIGRGDGLVRLVSDSNDGGRWKAFTLFTTLKELKGHEEGICNRRPTGLDDSHEDGGLNWKDRLTAQQNFDGDREPYVLILGRHPMLKQTYYAPTF